jgi:hypothetical protein
VISCPFCVGGRRPAGFEPGVAGEGSALGLYFSRLAELEAASVPAFRRMAHELARFGAPRRLVRAAERAAREERRHARGAEALTRRFGGSRSAFVVDVRGARSLETFSVENAVEGCVRETYGALVATWQARTATDTNVRAHMKRIAKDETRHAALAWQADAWARTRLSKEARTRVDVARAEAARALVQEMARDVPEALATIAGVPRAEMARRFAARLAAESFSGA